MSAARTITGTTKAWITEHSTARPEHLAEGDPRLVKWLAYSDMDMGTEGWVLVGKAQITIDLPSLDEVVTNQVAALRQQITNVRAEAENKATQLERQVQQLLAITMETGGAS